MLPERIPLLEVSIGDTLRVGQLLKTANYEFRYLDPDPAQASVALLMPAAARLSWQDGDLFPPMDQNLPEGDLFMRIRQMFPKQPMTPMHLLALMGRNGIGRLGYALPDRPAAAAPPPIGRVDRAWRPTSTCACWPPGARASRRRRSSCPTTGRYW